MNIERRKAGDRYLRSIFPKKQTLVRASKTKTLSCFFQLLLGPDGNCGVKAFGKRSMEWPSALRELAVSCFSSDKS